LWNTFMIAKHQIRLWGHRLSRLCGHPLKGCLSRSKVTSVTSGES
jgi:hypothetical protein